MFHLQQKKFVKKYSLRERVVYSSNNETYLPEKIIESAGSTGEPTMWLIEKGGQKMLSRQLNSYLDKLWSIKKNPSIYISCYSNGLYGGARLSDATLLLSGNNSNKLTVATPGSCVEDTIRLIKNLSKENIYKQYILGGYPPIIGKIIQEGIRSGIVWKDLNLKLTLGGDGFPEEWRDEVYDLLELKIDQNRNCMVIIDGYGATDNGKGGGSSPLTVLIRRMAYKDKSLRENLWNRCDILPSLAHTNPNFVVNAVNGHLIINCLSLTPQPNYDIEDAGWVHTFPDIIKVITGIDNYSKAYREVDRMLQNWGYSINEIMKSPIVSVLGRIHKTKMGTSIDGAVIHPQSIEGVLVSNHIPYNDFFLDLNVDENKADNLILKFIINIELQNNVDKSKYFRIQEVLEKKVLKRLLETNNDYSTSYNDNPVSLYPNIKLFSYNSGLFRDRHKRIKRIYMQK